MYDLNAIRQANEEAHAASVARALEDAEKLTRPSKLPKYPLTFLGNKLQVGPPSLTYLSGLMAHPDALIAFENLVDTYLPDVKDKIMPEDNAGKIREFVYYFERKYFPFAPEYHWNLVTLGEIVSNIPVVPMGFSNTNYHLFNDFRTGYILMLGLCGTMYDKSGGEDEDEDAGGGRVPILEAVINLVGKSLVDLIPPEGWDNDFIHGKFARTEHEGLVYFSDWVNASTGCELLDNPYEEWNNYTGGNDNTFDWNPSVVKSLTIQWPQVVTIQKKIKKTAAWFEKDIYRNYRDLVLVLSERDDLVIPKEQLALPIIM